MILENIFIDDDVGDVASIVDCKPPADNNWITLSELISSVGYTLDMAPPSD